MKNSLLIVIFSLIYVISLAQKQSVSGYVFLDQNNNNIYDAGDKALENIFVSNQKQIVKTNNSGLFEIPVNDYDIVFVIKPAEYKFALNKNSTPAFYKHCYQKKTKEQLAFDVIEEKTNLKDTLYFALQKENVTNEFKAHIIGDIQTPALQEVKFFRELIVPNLLKNKADFAVTLGDVADDDLSLYDDISNSLAPLNIPVYMLFGNHDVNLNASSNVHQAETFKKHYGPDYYSFNYGSTHYIALNNVIYNGWNKAENKKGHYNGGLTDVQFNWLKQDLELVPNDKRIVIMAHIPLMKGFIDSTHLVEIFSLFKGRNDILGLYGHTHSIISWQYNADNLWNNSGRFMGHVAGTACGGWWVSPFGADSLPDATSNDGAPAGTFLYEFNAQTYQKTFLPGGKAIDHQLRISTPFKTVHVDSLQTETIIVNVFDGDEHTKVTCQIDNGQVFTLGKQEIQDPFVVRNQYRRVNRDLWTPWVVDCSHLWQGAFPELEIGMHKIQVTCELSNGKKYSEIKIFEVVE